MLDGALTGGKMRANIRMHPQTRNLELRTKNLIAFFPNFAKIFTA